MNPATETPRLANIWDAPTRIYHWLMVALIVLQFGTAKFGWLDMQWHFYFGYALLTLMLFRISWGFFGSSNVRFAELMQGPRRLVSYLRNWRSQNVSALAGHNPVGGWSSIFLILVVLLQALTGLATSDDIEWYGPLCHRLPDGWSDWAEWLHHRLQILMLALIALHILAIALYWFVKRENLLAAMWHGRRLFDGEAPRWVSGWRALVLFVFSALLVFALIAWSN